MAAGGFLLIKTGAIRCFASFFSSCRAATRDFRSKVSLGPYLHKSHELGFAAATLALVLSRVDRPTKKRQSIVVTLDSLLPTHVSSDSFGLTSFVAGRQCQD